MLVDYRIMRFDFVGEAAVKIEFLDQSFIWCEDGLPDDSSRWVKKTVVGFGVKLYEWVNPPDNYRPKKPKATKKRSRRISTFGSD